MKPGLITIKVPINPNDTAVHLFTPTFSFKKNGDKAVTQIGATKAKVKALGEKFLILHKRTNK